MNKFLLIVTCVFGVVCAFLYFQLWSQPSGSADEELARLRIQNTALEEQIKTLNKLVIKNKKMLNKIDGGQSTGDESEDYSADNMDSNNMGPDNIDTE